MRLFCNLLITIIVFFVFGSKSARTVGGGGFLGAFPERYNIVVNSNHEKISAILTTSGEEQNKKVKQLKEIITRNNASTLIEVDGGVNLENAAKLFDAGADVLVAGNAVFSSESPERTIELLKI